MSTYSHSAISQRSLPHAIPITGPLAKGATGVATSVKMTALPDIRDVVQVWDGPQCIAQLVFWKTDTAKLNVAQTVNKPYGDRGLILKVLSDGGATGSYDLVYS